MFTKIISNKKGMSLVEVLVAAGLMVIVSAGLVGVVTSMQKEQNSQFRTTALRELKTRFQFLITDQNSWNKTLQLNSDGIATCIRNKQDCSGKGVLDVTLYDSSGTAFFTAPAWATTPATGNGFTDKGAPCTGFNGTAGAGNDACPISYKTVWEAICPASGRCNNPLIRVTVRMMYNPSSSSQNMALSMGSLSSTDDSNPANTGKYDVVIKRSAINVNKSFLLTVGRSGGAVGGPGGGACATDPSYTVRGDSSVFTGADANPAWREVEDVFDLVSVRATDATVPNGIIRIKAGSYSCKMTGVAWAVNSFKIQLLQGGSSVSGSIGASNANFASYTQATATSSPNINISSDTDFQFVQSCQSPNAVIPSDYKYNMGLPAQPYTAESIFATFSCTQTN